MPRIFETGSANSLFNMSPLCGQKRGVQRCLFFLEVLMEQEVKLSSFSQAFSNGISSDASTHGIEHGESYPAIIAGIFHATQDAYQGKAGSRPTSGASYLILYRDATGAYAWTTTKVFTLGSWSFGEKASYGNFCRAMLKSGAYDADLYQQTVDAGVGSPELWVGKPCLVTFAAKTSKTSGKSYFILDRVSAPTTALQGLKDIPSTSPVVDLSKVFPSFVHAAPEGRICMQGVVIGKQVPAAFGAAFGATAPSSDPCPF